MTNRRPDKIIRQGCCAALFTVALFSASPPVPAQTLAFPGAVGYGKKAKGFDGEVLANTSLMDGGPGTLRQCTANESRPGVCVFHVSGIKLQKPVKVGSNFYIAGQAAPGAGVQLRLTGSNQTPLVVKNVDNVLIRFLKPRPGTSAGNSASVDAITIEGRPTRLPRPPLDVLSYFAELAGDPL